MERRIGLTLLIVALSAGVLADLQCDDVTLEKRIQGVSCSACNQWASGTAKKAGSDSGWLCLYYDLARSYNVCDATTLLVVGSGWNENCINMSATASSATWTFDSSRLDWQDKAGSKAWLYVHVPCLNSDAEFVEIEWAETCDYCRSCQ